MYNIKLYDYVPEPQPVSSDYIVAAHYYAAWKKGAAGLHNAFFDLHDYPERTPLAGYYDEENPAYTDWEIKWALEHGINCFIYCWYRKRENMGKPVTVDDLRKWNNIKGNNIAAGQNLKVYSDKKVDRKTDKTDKKSKKKQKTHKVKRGETLGEIAEKYGVGLSKLKKANGIKGNNIQIGQSLKIPQ